MVVLEGGGERECDPRFPVSKNRYNHILAARFTTKGLLPGWDLTTTFVRAEPAFLLVVLVVVLVEHGLRSTTTFIKAKPAFLPVVAALVVGYSTQGPQFLKLE